MLASEIKKELVNFDLDHLNSLRDVALAAWYAHVVVVRNEPVEQLVKALVNEAVALKRALLIQANALAARGQLDAQRIAEIRAGRGNRELANNMIALSALFRQSWKQFQGKTLVNEEELDRSAELGTKLIQAIGTQKLDPGIASLSDSNELRARAFSLLYKTYDQVQRAVEYLRWDEGDAMEVAPSIYTGARRGRRAVEQEIVSVEAEPPAIDAAPSRVPVVIADPVLPATTLVNVTVARSPVPPVR